MPALVSILIPAFHSSVTIRQAIESCLRQSYPHFELIVVNNSPSDATSQLVNSIADSRIVYHENINGNTIAATRNQLLRLSKGQYIAWLDADDQMLENRLSKQVEFLEQNKSVDILGSWILTDDEDLKSKKLPLEPEQIRNCLWFKNCLIQPALMSRNFYKEEDIWYDETFENSVEDYELWYRLRNIKRFANLPEYLTHYHMTTGDELETKRSNNGFEKNIRRLWEIKWNDSPIVASSEDKQRFIRFLYENFSPDKQEFTSILKVLLQLKRSNQDPFFNLLAAYHKLRLFRNASLADKFTHLGLIRELLYWPEFKRNFLI